ncbi:hypothetical protein PBY51_008122 [Eleginops maclovinus]|uniref:CARD domain-containing protein n=1 Tax=Eleginops maclovinus TaxID=56733 RepID=A0AAN7XAE6_ELEMC|nr:hypothetical protein PBY51_008122 [Eleginops maclovinus]
MGSYCSALCKAKKKEDEATTKGESREKSPLMQRKPSLKEEGAMKETTEEDTLRSQVEESSSKEMACIEINDADVNTSSPGLSETHDTDSAMRVNKEAEWVDKNRAQLIQKVTLVMPIADELLQRTIIRQEMYANISAAKTTQDQMRAVYKTLTTTKAKSVFYRILQENQPQISESK